MIVDFGGLVYRYYITIMNMLFFFSQSSHASNLEHINFSGKLISVPCSIEPGMDNFYILMDEISIQSLYRFKRSRGKLIEFHFKGCDPELANYISAKFTGVLNYDGLLSLNPNSKAKGVGIGLEYLDRTPIYFNNDGYYKVLIKKGDMTIRMNAYLQGESDAIKNKTIIAGSYSTLMTYTLYYE